MREGFVMTKKVVDFWACQDEVTKAYQDKRVLLLGQGKSGKPNVMTIGWGSWGIIWKRPVFTVLVRPSRYTYPMLEETGEFSVNVLPPGKEEIAKFCGSNSGRSVDKFAAQGLTPISGRVISIPIVQECIINVECRIIYKSDLLPQALNGPIRAEIYGESQDLHRIFIGEIVSCLRG